MSPRNDPGREDGGQSNFNQDGDQDHEPEMRLPVDPNRNSQDDEEEEPEEGEDEFSEEEDDDDQGAIANGYQPIPQDPDMPSSTPASESAAATMSEETRRMVEQSEAERSRQEGAERARVWQEDEGNKTSAERAESIQLDEAKLRDIKVAMDKIRLPPAAVPGWARNMEEGDWKEVLSNKIAVKGGGWPDAGAKK